MDMSPTLAPTLAPTAAPTAAPTPAPTAAVQLEVTMTIKGVDFAELDANPNAKESFKNGVAETIAEGAGPNVTSAMVAVTLSEGSLIVSAVITFPGDASTLAEQAKSSLATKEKAVQTNVVENVKTNLVHAITDETMVAV